MDAETMFNEYWNYKRELTVLENQLQCFGGISKEDIIETLTFAKPQEEGTQRSGKSDKTAKIALNYENILAEENEKLYRFIVERYRVCAGELQFFEASVDLLPAELSAFVKDMVFNQLTWTDIEKKHNISRRTVGRYRKRAINKLNELYNYRADIG